MSRVPVARLAMLGAMFASTIVRDARAGPSRLQVKAAKYFSLANGTAGGGASCLATRRTYCIHIPKCGSTVLHVIRTYGGSPHVKEDHTPAPFGKEGDFFVVLRQPEQRLISSYLVLRNIKPRLPFRNWGWRNRWGAQMVRDAIRASPGDIDQAMSRFHGCQTNMMLGHRCFSEHMQTLPPSDRAVALETAKAALRRYGVIGILEHWRLTMCYFNWYHTGEPFFMPKQVKVLNPLAKQHVSSTRPGPTSLAVASKYNLTVEGMARDEYDGPLYDLALEIFFERLADAGVSERTCVERPDDWVTNCVGAETPFGPPRPTLLMFASGNSAAKDQALEQLALARIQPGSPFRVPVAAVQLPLS
mmetsp:Transcript_10688/g.27774  ORF Transcript_10688/g.27774 Transcript_10688/m.27774 type:complete len:360 (-) Transcript_10688:17-1096(-)